MGPVYCLWYIIVISIQYIVEVKRKYFLVLEFFFFLWVLISSKSFIFPAFFVSLMNQEGPSHGLHDLNLTKHKNSAKMHLLMHD